MAKRIFLLLFTFLISNSISFGQERAQNKTKLRGFVKASGFSKDVAWKNSFGLQYSDYLLQTPSKNYLIESPRNISAYIGDYCEINGTQINFSDNRWIFDCSVIDIDSIKVINFEPDYSNQDSLIEFTPRLIYDDYEQTNIDTIQGYLTRDTRYAPDISTDYTIKVDHPIKYAGGETENKYEMISQLTIYPFDFNMIYNFEKHLRSNKKIKVEGILKSGYAHQLTLVTLKIIE